ncbi:MAG: J domain-containing protein [Salinigranum sp.]
MDRDRLLLGVAAVFAGLTTLLAVAALAEQPFLLVIAAPFAATTFFLWYHATGRLEARIRARSVSDPRGRTRAGVRDAAPGGGARGRSTDRTGRGDPTGRADPTGRRRGRNAGAAGSAGPAGGPAGLSRSEAYRTLDLEPGATAAEVRRAYRSRVKEVHPDAEAGDEETFKRVNRAYERLNG